MKRLCKSCDESVFELFDDIIIEILHRLPSKSLARFICVCKNWHKYIADPSLVYSCRSRRWSPQPHMIGFFCQDRDFDIEFPAIRFFLSSTKSSEVIDGSLDESVNLLGRGIYIIASSNGFILIAEDLKYQSVYHVYNPATRQRFSVPVIQISRIRVAVIGFHCKVDDPEKDLISFTIVRFEVELYRSISSVIIESFSSDTNVWTTVNLTLDEPLRVWLSYWDNLASAGVIDGVFCWIDYRQQIILYDSVNRRFWALQLTQEMNVAEAWCFGVSSGELYYASYDEADITVWCLESNIRSQDAVWVRKCVVNVTDAVVKFCPEGSEADVMIMDIHPAANPHIFFLVINGRVISYDLEKKIAEFLYDTGEGDYLYFTYEWHQWPRLLRQSTRMGLGQLGEVSE